MATYRYSDSPLIDRVEIISPHPGMIQAVIVARSDASGPELEKLRAQLSRRHLSTLIDMDGDSAAIQVRGIKSEKSFLSALGGIGLNAGTASVETTPKEKARKIGLQERVRNKSLFTSALFYDLGNAAFIVSGIQRGRHNPDGKFTSHDISEMGIGGAFAVGDILMTAYGHERGDEQLSAAALGLKKYLYAQGVEIPKGNALSPDSLHDKGIFKAADQWMRRHVVQVKCMSEMAGGLTTIYASLKPGNLNRGKLTAGLLITTGWLATVMLEKPRGDEVFTDEKSGVIPKKIADNPRGWIARPMAISNNIANLWGSLNSHDGERKRFQDDVSQAKQTLQQAVSSAGATAVKDAEKYLAYAQAKQHDFIWNVISASSFMIAHSLFGLSGKHRPKATKEDKHLQNDLVLLSANMLAQQPDAVREAAILQTAQYVSKLAPVDLSTEEAASAIRDKIDALSHGTWASRTQSTPDVASQER